jgi:hypothetical protein
MKHLCLITLTLLFTIFSSYAQNTFPASGNVGIGTTSPVQPLDVTGTGGSFSASARATALFVQDHTNYRGVYIGYDNSGQIGVIAPTTVNAPSNLAFWNYRTSGGWFESLRITSDGNVGIGTTVPSSKLQINESSDSKPGGVVAATKSVFKLSRFGTPNYSYNESAEFRIGHGGPSVWGSKLELFVNGGSNQTDIPDQQVMTWLYNGNVGIGTSTPQETLSVNGNIRSKQVKVEVANWPDYVFRPDYQLPSLADTKIFIDQNHHLPEIPSEAEVTKNGLNLGEMNKLLLKKVEELTLYLIEKDNKEKELEGRIKRLEKQVKN